MGERGGGVDAREEGGVGVRGRESMHMGDRGSGVDAREEDVGGRESMGEKWGDVKA